MNPIQLQLTLDEINAILNSLGQQPYVQVFALIEKSGNKLEIRLLLRNNIQETEINQLDECRKSRK